MALSDEQNAMLRLLASGEQGYDDIAALMGLSVTEVRAKVVGALAQLEAEGKPVPDVPSPVVGGAKPAADAAPPAPEPVPEPPAAEPSAPVTAEKAPADAEPAAEASTAKPADAKAAATPTSAPAAATPPPSTPPSGGRTITLPSGRNAWLLGGGIAAIVVIVVVILLVSGGGSDNSSSTTSGSTTPSTETGAGEDAAGKEAGAESTPASGTKEPTVAKLVATDGSKAEGQATFGRIKNKLALAVEATGLEPTTASTSYTVWLAQSPTKMLPLASTAVKASGKGAGEIGAEFEVPVEVLAYLANGTFAELAVTRTNDAELDAAIKSARKEKTTPAYTGEEVLHGQITGPIVGLADREKEEKSE
ncbi:MAG TPA: hypothetical protein VGC32_17120 [Solirubrobacterales bacterium]